MNFSCHSPDGMTVWSTVMCGNCSWKRALKWDLKRSPGAGRCGG